MGERRAPTCAERECESRDVLEDLVAKPRLRILVDEFGEEWVASMSERVDRPEDEQVGAQVHTNALDRAILPVLQAAPGRPQLQPAGVPTRQRRRDGQRSSLRLRIRRPAQDGEDRCALPCGSRGSSPSRRISAHGTVASAVYSLPSASWEWRNTGPALRQAPASRFFNT